jgi:hypothetical protein
VIRPAARLALVLTALLLFVPACVSDDDEGASASEVERALRADLLSGDERVVDLGTGPPKLVECKKDPDTATGWRCTVVAVSGRSIICIVQAESESGKTIRRVCAPVDN